MRPQLFRLNRLREGQQQPQQQMKQRMRRSSLFFLPALFAAGCKTGRISHTSFSFSLPSSSSSSTALVSSASPPPPPPPSSSFYSLHHTTTTTTTNRMITASSSSSVWSTTTTILNAAEETRKKKKMGLRFSTSPCWTFSSTITNHNNDSNHTAPSTAEGEEEAASVWLRGGGDGSGCCTGMMIGYCLSGMMLRPTFCCRAAAVSPPGSSPSPPSSSSIQEEEGPASLTSEKKKRDKVSRSRCASNNKDKEEDDDDELTEEDKAAALRPPPPDYKQHCVSPNVPPPPKLPTPPETGAAAPENIKTTATTTATTATTTNELAKVILNTCMGSMTQEEADALLKKNRMMKEEEEGKARRGISSSSGDAPSLCASASVVSGGTTESTGTTGTGAGISSSSSIPPIKKKKKKSGAPALSGDHIPIWRVVKLVLRYIWPAGEWKMKFLVASSVGCVLVAKVLKVMLPFAFKAVIDALSLSPAAAGGGSGGGAAAGAFMTSTSTGTTAAAVVGGGGGGVAVMGPLALTACGFVAAYGLCRVAGSVSEELKNVFFAPVGGAGSTNLAMQMVRKLHDLDLPFHLNRETGVLSKDLDRGSRAFWNLAYLLLFMIAPTAFEMGLVGLALYSQGGGPFIGIAVTAVATYIVWTLTITNWRAKFRARYNHYDSRVGGRIVDSLLNYETVKYFGSEAYECERIEREVRKMNRQLVILDQSIALLNVGQQLIFAAAAVGSLYMATCGVLAGHMTVGDLVLVDGLLLQLYMPLSYLGMIYRDVQSSTQNMQAMIALMDAEPTVRDAPGVVAYEHKTGTIEFRDVSFEYTVPAEEVEADDEATTKQSVDSSPAPPPPLRRFGILHRVSLTIPGGSVVAFVGASGSGKSTIFRLLFRFFNPTSGEILLDGQPLQSLSIASVRKYIGVIPQDPVLFNETVRYNICYGRPGTTAEELERVARGARVHDTIMSLVDGYDTVAGERGCKLSGGEKQRVAVARALLDDRPILLADEATSALDTATEAGVIQSLRSSTRSGTPRTVLMIAHRLSTVKDADIIFVLGGGTVAEYGCHEELLERNGIYAKLWSQQLKEKEEEKKKKKTGVEEKKE